MRERERDTETENRDRDRDRETERQRDRETERQRDRETERRERVRWPNVHFDLHHSTRQAADGLSRRSNIMLAPSPRRVDIPGDAMGTVCLHQSPR